MSSTQKNSSQPEASNTPDLLLGLAVAPVLAGLWGGQILLEWMREVGQVSEEILRGDRLPTLNFPPSEERVGDPELGE
ncbi:hypothetical protein IQ235_14030 [Oscillatoriales cyanobacterium LEGE 11467]|uniref:Uncharacterized protein n=1 Tax=Zarconia navalis LEGE 11467 TaxID=1828826 RepID=A0A928VZV2_9CYAN|nr:hypothetical protein [Zarconia navalis]MBE9041897.1 hypothetical protein [Zarconia navalis LEGE 11467]